MRITLDCALRAKEIKDILRAESALDNNLEFKFITTSSKEASRGDLFIAIRGENFDGNDYAKEALERGAYPICERALPSSFKVKDTKSALFSLAALYKTKLKKLKYTVAITGSVGKSTTKEFTKALLSRKYKLHATEENENNHIGVPLTVLRASSETEVLVIEAGMNHLGEIREISECIKPDIAVITNIGTAHIGNLGSREMIAKAKLEILAGMSGGAVLLPYEEPLLSGKKNGIYLSQSATDAYSHFENVNLTAKESSFDYISKKSRIRHLVLSVGGRHLLTCLQYAIVISELFGLEEKEIKDGIFSISRDNMRQKHINILNFRIFDDSYNSSYDSVKAAFDMLAMSNAPFSALLSDMLELGEYTEMLHIEIGKSAARAGTRRLYLFGRYAEFIKKGALLCGFDENRIFINPDLSSPLNTALDILKNTENGETVLFKGSHSTRLYRVTDMIKKLSEERDVR